MDALGDIEWKSLRHDLGPAGDIPVLLLAARTSDAVHRDLEDRLNSNEFEVSEAAAAAWPFVLELAASPDTPSREWLLDGLYASNAELGARIGGPWTQAWEAAKPALLALLDDPSPEMRRSALFVVGQGRGDSSLVLPALSRRWSVETDPVTRLWIVYAAVEFAGFGDEATVSWLQSLVVPDDEPEARMLVSAAVRPDAAVIVRGLTGNLGLFLAATSQEMGYDQVLEHVLWLLRDNASARIALGLKLLEEPSWRQEALEILHSEGK